jgi:hypothetical protein
VLAFCGSGNEEAHLTAPHSAEVWDPDSGEIKIIEQQLAGDIFCAGHAFLPDGRLLVAGGTCRYDRKLFGLLPIPPFGGLEHTYIFDPASETWTRAQDMGNSRWYPTLITLGDGRILAMAGLTRYFPWAFLRTIETYSPSLGWRKLAGAERWLPLYPRLHLLPNGDVFYAGSYNTHYTFPFTVKGFPTATLNPQTGAWQTIGLPSQSQREEGATLLLPLLPPDYKARVILIGGGTPTGQEASADVESIDLSESNPRWERAKPMQHARYYVYAVMLPNRQIFVIGGRKGLHAHQPTAKSDVGAQHEGHDDIPRDPHAIHAAELFNPETNEWTSLAPMTLDRLYHSNAMLLPDGRVMVAGSNPRSGVNERRIEIYRPPYLFQGPRPRIETAPAEVSYGQEFEIDTPDAEDVDAVALIRPSTTTHCLDTEQRYVGLAFNRPGSGQIVAQVPGNKNLVPPGYYMLFIVHAGIPSTARFVHVS